MEACISPKRLREILFIFGLGADRIDRLDTLVSGRPTLLVRQRVPRDSCLFKKGIEEFGFREVLKSEHIKGL